MAENFMTGFMRGYSFMQGIEDNQRRRERDDYTFNRLQKADVRTDQTQIAEDWAAQKKWLFTGKGGERLTEKQVLADPDKRQRITDLQNSPGFKGMLMDGAPKGIDEVRMEEAVVNPNGSVTPVFTQLKKGAVVASGPATINRTSKDADITQQGSIQDWMNKMDTHAAKFSRSFVDNEVTSRKEAGRKRDLNIVLSNTGSTQQVRQQQVQGQVQQQDQQTTTGAPAPVTTTQGQDQQAPAPTQEPVAEEVADPNSITERAKPKKAVSLGSLAESAGKKLEGVGANIFKRGVKGTVSQFNLAAEGKPNTGSKLALDNITGFPRASGRKLIDNYTAIEKKIGSAKAQEMRKVIYDSLKNNPNRSDPSLEKELERLEVLPSKAVKEMGKVEKALPTNISKLKESIKKDQKLISSMKSGTRFGKQSNKSTKEYREALIRLHIADPKSVPLSMVDRGLRTGRLTKSDIQVVATKNFIGLVDKEAGTLTTLATFADPASKKAEIKAQRDALKDETAGFEKTIKLKYGTDKKAQGRRDTFAQRLSTSVPTWGIDVRQVTKNFGMISRAEDIINGHQGGTGFLGFFKEHPSEYPSLTPGIIAQSLGKRTLSEANKAFFTPIQESRAYNGGPIPEGEARNLANLAVGIHMRNPSKSIEEVNAMIVNILQSPEGRNIARSDPASVLKSLFSN